MNVHTKPAKTRAAPEGDRRRSRRIARARTSTPSTGACASCWRSTCRPTCTRIWSRTSSGSACSPAGASTSWPASPTRTARCCTPRDRFGRDEDWIEYHPAYREMEAIAFGDFQFHAMSHRAGVLGLDAPMHPVAKYACQYLFVQGEFGIMCPISVTDTSIYLIRKYASPELKDYLLPRMLSADPAMHVEGHAVHDREGRRLGHRPGRDGGAQRGRHLAALRREVVLLARRRRRGPDAGAARRRARGHRGPRACSPCRGGSRTARATATGSCG